MTAPLRASVGPLSDAYDVALLDLDGVVYIGPDAVPGAAFTLSQLRRSGMRVAFVTNNAARTPEAVAGHLRDLGIQADPDEVVTSAQAAARHLAERLPAGATILVLGTTGLLEAVRGAGLRPVQTDDPEVAAVVQGYSPDMNWRLLAEGAVAINRGVPWVATNVDPTVPSPRGPLPGNGSLVAALGLATGMTPSVTGKPDPTMHRESLLRSGATAPIVVGDRLDTDIEGATAVGCPSLLVLSGVTDLRQLLAATPQQRPSYLSATVAGLLNVHHGAVVSGSGARCGRWSATAAEHGVTVSVDGAAAHQVGASDVGASDVGASDVGASDDALDAARAACAAWWASTDAQPAEQAAQARPPTVRAADERSARLISSIGLLDD